MKYTVLIFDVTGIQRYIFGSNRLIENLGASYTVSECFNSFLKETLKGMNLSIEHFDSWRDNRSSLLKNNPHLKYEVVYLGGGNIILITTDKAIADDITRRFTKDLLIKAPGLSVASAFIEVDYESFFNEYDSYNGLIFEKLNIAKNSQVVINKPYNFGITAECPRSGDTAEIYYSKDKCYISSVSYVKIKNSQEAKKRIEEEYKGLFQDKFCFTDDLENLWQSKDSDNHIAVVHIDGNNMGRRFRKIKTVAELRKLSIMVENITKNSFRALLESIIEKIDILSSALGRTDIPLYDNKKILPIRPIIIGGDDITFVTDGRLGIYFAKIFMSTFEDLGKSLLDEDGEGLTCCGGVAIARTKYPFYRVYNLSEELCASAKSYKKKNNAKGSFIDFHINHQGISNSIDVIRENNYKTEDGSLIFRPYKIGSYEDRGLERLIENAKKLKGFSKNKIKDLRQALYGGRTEVSEFLIRNKDRHFKLPDFDEKGYAKEVFYEGVTPYFDILEFMELYPLNIDEVSQ
ncbi:MAG: hypothetical protein N2999_05985 [Proteobacteria bacterium]|nr:hypothetical protein [Pseudomonadota bacterium]